jgi:hypothetical protein
LVFIAGRCSSFQRFVDRDMVMRYHFGLAVGHEYTHGLASRGLDPVCENPEEEDIHDPDSEVMGPKTTPADQEKDESDSQGSSCVDNTDYELDDWDNEGDEGEEGDNDFDGESDDEELAAMHEMYGI